MTREGPAVADQPGLATFVGRVRGHLDADDEAWVEGTSDAIEDLRERLVDASDRLGRLQRRMPDPTVHAPDETTAEGASSSNTSASPEDLTAWELVVAWATIVNGALVEAAARRRLPAPPSVDPAATAAVAAEQAAHVWSDRTVDLGRALQSIRGEQVVDELLGAGVLVAPPGTASTEAFAPHGAWDIEFLTRGGTTIARADVVVTADPDEVLHHLATRPGVDLVYTTSDTAAALQGSEGLTVVRAGERWPDLASAPDGGVVVVDVGIDSGALHAELVGILDQVDPGASADALVEAVPVLALLLVGGRAVSRVATTDDAGADIATATWGQVTDVVTTAGVSELVGWASGMNLLKVPTTLTFAFGRAAVRDARAELARSGRRVNRARRLIEVADPT